MPLPKSKKHLLVTLLLPVSFRCTASFFIIRHHHDRHHVTISRTSTSTARPAYDLNSAFEWLSEERHKNPGYSNIEWLDIVSSSSPPAETSNQKLLTEQPQHNDEGLVSTSTIMPLYPLGATYLPSTVNQTLNNVEPQNLQMAKDLLSSGFPTPRFCVALRAMDTGRIANIGTVLQILEADEQFQEDGTLVRIRLTCRAEEELVEICDIINPQAFARENRLRKSSEYLRCQVRVRQTLDNEADTHTMEEKEELLKQEIETMVGNFNMIKTIYQLEIGKAEFPPSTLFQLGNAMSTWDATENFSSEAAFWASAQEWQSVCYTIRQGKQSMLSINRNELMVEAASAAGGPLKLPIHLEDLSPQVQRQIQLMEVEAQKEYFQLGMDPCLDFQALVSLPNYHDQILGLTQLISRERSRLEVLATESSRKARA